MLFTVSRDIVFLQELLEGANCMETPVKLPLGGYIQGTAPMKVPRFQRPYAWTDDEIADFIQDLRRTSAQRRELDGDRRDGEIHFFGGILSTQFAQPDTTPTYTNEVIDGQQRVATVILTLVVLRKAFSHVVSMLEAEGRGASDEAVLARGLGDSIWDLYLSYSHQDLRTGKADRRHALTLSDLDSTFFKAIVGGAEPTVPRNSPPSHTRIRNAFRKLERELVAPIYEDGGSGFTNQVEALRDILVVLTKNFYVIKLYTQANRREAYQLFMVLNDRGVSLSDAELLRTRSLELLQAPEFARLQSEVADSWDRVFEASNSDVSGFLAAYFASRTGERAPRRNLYDAFLNHIFPDHDSFEDERAAEEFRDLIQQLQREHVAYRAIAAGEWPFESANASYWHQKRLERLTGVLGRKGDIPLLLAAWAVNPNDDTDFSRFVDQMERFGFRWHAANAHSGTLSEAYYEQAVQLRADPFGYSFQDFVAEMSPLVASHVPDSDFEAGLQSRLRYGSSPTNRVVKHALTTVDDYWKGLHDHPTTRHPELKPGVETAYDLSQVQIEHVYPQEPQVGHREAALDAVVHQVGNLTFLSSADNIGVSNKPFIEKRTGYRTASSRMTRALADEMTWSSTMVSNRGDQLVGYLKRIYALSEDALSGVVAHRAHWLVSQNDGPNPYGDVFGQQYGYRAKLPNGRRVKAGDIAVIMILGPKKSERLRQIAGIAEIANIAADDDGTRRAIFSRFFELPRWIHIDSLTEDPRSNRQHSINRVSAEFVEQFLPEDMSLGDLPEVM